MPNSERSQLVIGPWELVIESPKSMTRERVDFIAGTIRLAGVAVVTVGVLASIATFFGPVGHTWSSRRSGDPAWGVGVWADGTACVVWWRELARPTGSNRPGFSRAGIYFGTTHE